MLRRSAQIAFFFIGLVLVASAGTVPADARSQSRHAAFIVDGNTGAVLHQDDADELRHPASLTKMMTLYLTFETLEQGRMSMSSKVTISQEAASVAPSKLDLDPGEEITVRDAILALITKSANDVATALAEKIGGNRQNFVRLMNAKARELGMTKTNFENPSGLPDPDQVTTARDMVTLGLHLQDDFPQYYPLFATRVFTYAGHSHRNHNTLMNNFSGIDGIKTGYTQASGFNLVSSVRRSGRHVVGAVFGGSSAASRNAEMRVLLTRALTKASTVKTRKPQPAYIAKLKGEPKRAERPAKPKPVEVAQAEPVAKPVRPAEPVRAAEAKAQALAKPAPAPKPAKVEPVASTAAPAEDEDKAETASETGTATDPAVAQPQQMAQAAASAAPAPIAVTKVRRIMVAPRQGPRPPAPAPSETTDMEASDSAPEAAAPAPRRLAAAGSPPSASSIPFVTETIVAKTTKGSGAVVAALPEGRASMLGASDLAAQQAQEEPAAEAQAEATSPAPAPAAAQPAKPVAPTIKTAAAAPPAPAPVAKAAPAATKPVAAASVAKPVAAPVRTASATPAVAERKSAAKPAAAQPAVQRGLPPSSLSAQAAALQSGKPQRVAELSPATGSIGGRFEIQIGAFASLDEAQRALDAVHQRAGSVIANHASVTQPVDKGGRQIYRARFRGFDAASAASACGSLRQQSFDCFVMTAE